MTISTHEITPTKAKAKTKKRQDIAAIFAEYQASYVSLCEFSNESESDHPAWIKFHKLTESMQDAHPINAQEALALVIFAFDMENPSLLKRALPILVKEMNFPLNNAYRAMFDLYPNNSRAEK